MDAGPSRLTSADADVTYRTFRLEVTSQGALERAESLARLEAPTVNQYYDMLAG